MLPCSLTAQTAPLPSLHTSRSVCPSGTSVWHQPSALHVGFGGAASTSIVASLRPASSTGAASASGGTGTDGPVSGPPVSEPIVTSASAQATATVTSAAANAVNLRYRFVLVI